MNKTKVIIFGSNANCPPLCLSIDNLIVNPVPTVKYLGVTLDESLKFESHIIAVCKSSFAFLRSLYRVKRYLPKCSVISIAHAFVSSRLDYCNSIFSFCNCRTVKRLQRVQNCLARFVLGLPRYTPTSNAIFNLGWLRVDKRIDFKICCLVHNCLYGSSPSYISNLICPAHSSHSAVSLRSQSSSFLFTPIAQSAFVRKSFVFKAPRIWNSLPLHIRNEHNFSVFKRLLKAHLLYRTT